MRGLTLLGLVRGGRRQHDRQSGYAKESRLAMDEFDVNTTPDDHSGEEQALHGSSRRNFLKAAVVGSAAAVAAGGVGAATLTLTGHHTGLKRIVGLDGLVSGVTGNACTTNTQDPLGDKTSFNQQESIYFWFKVNNVPAGTYTFDVAPPIDLASVKKYTSGGPLLQYQSGSNDVNVYQYTPSDATFECEPPSLASLQTLTPLGTQDTLPIIVITTATKDLLLQVHLQGEKDNPGGSVTLTGTLYQGTGTGGAVEKSANATFTIA